MITDYNDILGWFDFQSIYISAINKIQDNELHYFLELGTFLGKSTCFLGSKIRESGKNIRVVALDTFTGVENCDVQKDAARLGNGSFYWQFWQNVLDLQLGNIIIPFVGTSDDIIKIIPNDLYFDLVFIDGNHDPKWVERDIDNLYPKVKIRGICAGHDYTPPFDTNELCKSVKRFAESVNKQVHVDNVSWVIIK